MTDLVTTGRRDSRKHRNIHLDMTPMVDLAFLLLTFFILTTTMVSQRSMELRVSDPGRGPVPESKALTLLLEGGNKLYWYQGTEASLSRDSLHRVGYNPSGLHAMLLKWNSRQEGDRTVRIKSSDKARYGNLVDVLDEMQICGIARYCMVELSEKEKQLLQEVNQR